MDVLGQTHSDDHGILVRAPAPLARAMTDTAKIRIIPLHQPAQWIYSSRLIFDGFPYHCVRGFSRTGQDFPARLRLMGT